MQIIISVLLTVVLNMSVISSVISPAEYAAALSIPMGKPSKDKMSCLVSSSPVDHLADITQAVFSRTWPRNEVSFTTKCCTNIIFLTSGSVQDGAKSDQV